MKKSIVFSDFDGTITFKDSFIEFIKFYKGRNNTFIGFLANIHYIIAYKLKIISNEKAKELLFSYFFKDEPLKYFQEKCQDFSLNIIPTIIRAKALETLQKHQSQNHTVVIVSASLEIYLSNWCKHNGFELIATQIVINDEKVTGAFLSKNCYGIEKENRIKETYCLEEYACVYAYGDTKGDQEMLALAHQSFYQPFHK